MRKLFILFLISILLFCGCVSEKKEEKVNLIPLEEIKSLKCEMITTNGFVNSSALCEFDDGKFYYYKDKNLLNWFYNNTLILKNVNDSVKIIYINYPTENILIKINAFRNLVLPLYDNKSFTTKLIERKNNYIYILRENKYKNISIGYYIKNGLPIIVDLGGGIKIYIKYLSINKPIAIKRVNITPKKEIIFANVKDLNKIKDYLEFNPIIFNITIKNINYNKIKDKNETKEKLKIMGLFENKTVIILEEHPYNGPIYFPIYENLSYDHIKAYYNPLGSYLITDINNTLIKIYADNETAIKILRSQLP
ncbi:hypothetical protein [Methanocaldococcus sp.]